MRQFAMPIVPGVIAGAISVPAILLVSLCSLVGCRGVNLGPSLSQFVIEGAVAGGLGALIIPRLPSNMPRLLAWVLYAAIVLNLIHWLLSGIDLARVPMMGYVSATLQWSVIGVAIHFIVRLLEPVVQRLAVTTHRSTAAEIAAPSRLADPLMRRIVIAVAVAASILTILIPPWTATAAGDTRTEYGFLLSPPDTERACRQAQKYAASIRAGKILDSMSCGIDFGRVAMQLAVIWIVYFGVSFVLFRTTPFGGRSASKP